MTTRVILDTNVFVAAGFKPQSASARIVAAIREGRYLLVWNESTRSEAKSVLSRIPRLSWEDASALFTPAGEFVGSVFPDAFPQVADPNDRKFAALGAAAGCPVVTSDDHLLAHRETFPFAVLTPASFVGREGLEG